LAGFDLRAVDWPLLASMLLLTSIGLSSMGFAIAWWLDSTQGYHVVMSVLLIPLWILSGAMFPLEGAAGWIRWMMKVNPMAYSVAGIRRGLCAGLLLDRAGRGRLLRRDRHLHRGVDLQPSRQQGRLMLKRPFLWILFAVCALGVPVGATLLSRAHKQVRLD